MKKLLAAAVTTLTLILSTTSLSYAAPPTANTGQEVPSAQSSTTDTSPKLSPFLPFGTIGLCNAGWGEVSVQRYDNAKYLGPIDLRCGDSRNGYIHIRGEHQKDWQKRIEQVGIGGNWDDLMAWVTGQAVTYPEPGFPKYVGANKYCYTTPVFMHGPRGSIQFRPTIIVSTNNKHIITSFPTNNPRC